jgi:hypothetical protein
MCKGSQLSVKTEATRTKGDTLGVPVANVRDSHEVVIPDKTVYIAGSLFLGAVCHYWVAIIMSIWKDSFIRK